MPIKKFFCGRDIERSKSLASEKIIPTYGKTGQIGKPIFFPHQNKFYICSPLRIISKPQMAKIIVQNFSINPIIAGRFDMVEKVERQAPDIIRGDVGIPESQDPGMISPR